MTVEWIWGKPLIQGFSNQPQKGYSEIEPDAGIPFRRLMFTDIYDLATCTFDLDRSQYPRFMSWYRTELRQGTIPFEIFDCRYGVKRTARLVGDVPQFTTNSNRYTLNLTIAFMPEVLSTEFNLVVNENDSLIVNSFDVLVVNQLLRA